MRLLILDDPYDDKSALLSSLAEVCQCTVVGITTNSLEVMQKAFALQPQVIVVRRTSFETISKLHRENPAVSIISIADDDAEVFVLQNLGAGACGYVLNDTVEEDLPRAIHAMRTGKRFLSARVEEILLEAYLRNLRKDNGKKNCESA